MYAAQFNGKKKERVLLRTLINDRLGRLPRIPALLHCIYVGIVVSEVNQLLVVCALFISYEKNGNLECQENS